MTYYAVIDTNVVVSSMLKSTSVPGQIVDLALKGEIVPLLNQEILDEYEEVLLRNEFGFKESDVKDLLDLLNEKAVFLDRTPTDELFNDPDDVVFYEIVLTARKSSDAYLITGNTKHYPVKTFVVTPKEMLEIIAAAQDAVKETE